MGFLGMYQAGKMLGTHFTFLLVCFKHYPPLSCYYFHTLFSQFVVDVYPCLVCRRTDPSLAPLHQYVWSKFLPLVRDGENSMKWNQLTFPVVDQRSRFLSLSLSGQSVFPHPLTTICILCLKRLLSSVPILGKSVAVLKVILILLVHPKSEGPQLRYQKGHKTILFWGFEHSLNA